MKDSQPVLRDSQPLQKGKESKKEVSKKGDKDNSKEGSKEGNTKGGKDGSKDNSKEGKDKPTLPPKRNLPFAKPTTRQAQKQVDKDVSMVDGSNDEETSDDEL